jgi:hypothetical protein
MQLKLTNVKKEHKSTLAKVVHKMLVKLTPGIRKSISEYITHLFINDFVNLDVFLNTYWSFLIHIHLTQTYFG